MSRRAGITGTSASPDATGQEARIRHQLSRVCVRVEGIRTMIEEDAPAPQTLSEIATVLGLFRDLQHELLLRRLRRCVGVALAVEGSVAVNAGVEEILTLYRRRLDL